MGFPVVANFVPETEDKVSKTQGQLEAGKFNLKLSQDQAGAKEGFPVVVNFFQQIEDKSGGPKVHASAHGMRMQLDLHSDIVLELADLQSPLRN